jgi:NAD+ synthase
VIGLSGGIDSAVSAALAARALGPENIIVLRLPCGVDAGESIRVAGEVARSLGIPAGNVFTLNIAEAVEAAWKTSAPLGRKGDEKLQRGNMAARMRMIVLEHACSLHRAILLGTENRTEHLLAYYTIGGDNISGLEPFQDLFKSEVYQLAAHLDLPKSVLKRQPTAELWADQTDEGELGVDYLTIDTILVTAFDRNRKKDEIAREHNIPRETVKKVLDHVASKNGKRNAPYLVP